MNPKLQQLGNIIDRLERILNQTENKSALHPQPSTTAKTMQDFTPQANFRSQSFGSNISPILFQSPVQLVQNEKKYQIQYSDETYSLDDHRQSNKELLENSISLQIESDIKQTSDEQSSIGYYSLFIETSMLGRVYKEDLQKLMVSGSQFQQIWQQQIESIRSWINSFSQVQESIEYDLQEIKKQQINFQEACLFKAKFMRAFVIDIYNPMIHKQIKQLSFEVRNQEEKLSYSQNMVAILNLYAKINNLTPQDALNQLTMQNQVQHEAYLSKLISKVQKSEQQIYQPQFQAQPNKIQISELRKQLSVIEEIIKFKVNKKWNKIGLQEDQIFIDTMMNLSKIYDTLNQDLYKYFKQWFEDLSSELELVYFDSFNIIKENLTFLQQVQQEIVQFTSTYVDCIQQIRRIYKDSQQLSDRVQLEEFQQVLDRVEIDYMLNQNYRFLEMKQTKSQIKQFFHLLTNKIQCSIQETLSKLTFEDQQQKLINFCEDLGGQIHFMIVRNNNFSKIFKNQGNKDKRIKDYINLNHKILEELTNKIQLFHLKASPMKLIIQLFKVNSEGLLQELQQTDKKLYLAFDLIFADLLLLDDMDKYIVYPSTEMKISELYYHSGQSLQDEHSWNDDSDSTDAKHHQLEKLGLHVLSRSSTISYRDSVNDNSMFSQRSSNLSFSSRGSGATPSFENDSRFGLSLTGSHQRQRGLSFGRAVRLLANKDEYEESQEKERKQSFIGKKSNPRASIKKDKFVAEKKETSNHFTDSSSSEEVETIELKNKTAKPAPIIQTKRRNGNGRMSILLSKEPLTQIEEEHGGDSDAVSQKSQKNIFSPQKRVSSLSQVQVQKLREKISKIRRSSILSDNSSRNSKEMETQSHQKLQMAASKRHTQMIKDPMKYSNQFQSPENLSGSDSATTPIEHSDISDLEVSRKKNDNKKGMMEIRRSLSSDEDDQEFSLNSSDREDYRKHSAIGAAIFDLNTHNERVSFSTIQSAQTPDQSSRLANNQSLLIFANQLAYQAKSSFLLEDSSSKKNLLIKNLSVSKAQFYKGLERYFKPDQILIMGMEKDKEKEKLQNYNSSRKSVLLPKHVIDSRSSLRFEEELTDSEDGEKIEQSQEIIEERIIQFMLKQLPYYEKLTEIILQYFQSEFVDQKQFISFQGFFDYLSADMSYKQYQNSLLNLNKLEKQLRINNLKLKSLKRNEEQTRSFVKFAEQITPQIISVHLSITKIVNILFYGTNQFKKKIDLNLKFESITDNMIHYYEHLSRLQDEMHKYKSQLIKLQREFSSKQKEDMPQMLNFKYLQFSNVQFDKIETKIISISERLSQVFPHIQWLLDINLQYVSLVIRSSRLLLQYQEIKRTNSVNFRVFEENAQKQIICDYQLYRFMISEDNNVGSTLDKLAQNNYQQFRLITGQNTYVNQILKHLYNIMKLDILSKKHIEKSEVLKEIIDLSEGKDFSSMIEDWSSMLDDQLYSIMGLFLNKFQDINQYLNQILEHLISLRDSKWQLKQIYEKIKSYNLNYGQHDVPLSFIEEGQKLSQVFVGGSQFEDFYQFLQVLERLVKQTIFQQKSSNLMKRDEIDEIIVNLKLEMQNFEKNDTKVAILKRFQEIIDEYINDQ